MLFTAAASVSSHWTTTTSLLCIWFLFRHLENKSVHVGFSYLHKDFHQFNKATHTNISSCFYLYVTERPRLAEAARNCGKAYMCVVPTPNCIIYTCASASDGEATKSSLPCRMFKQQRTWWRKTYQGTRGRHVWTLSPAVMKTTPPAGPAQVCSCQPPSFRPRRPLGLTHQPKCSSSVWSPRWRTMGCVKADTGQR